MVTLTQVATTEVQRKVSVSKSVSFHKNGSVSFQKESGVHFGVKKQITGTVHVSGSAEENKVAVIAEKEEKKADEEKEVEQYMDHETNTQGNVQYAPCMNKEYRVNLEKKLRLQYGAQWETHYWDNLVNDMEQHYQGNLSQVNRNDLRVKYEGKYGQSWRKFYWRKLAQDMEMHFDGDKVGQLKKQYGEQWRMHYGPYAYYYGPAHGHPQFHIGKPVGHGQGQEQFKPGGQMPQGPGNGNNLRGHGQGQEQFKSGGQMPQGPGNWNNPRGHGPMPHGPKPFPGGHGQFQNMPPNPRPMGGHHQ
jgi:hypothetical protein